MRQLNNTNNKYIITYLQINTSLILYQVDDMTEKKFNETQQMEYVVKEKASIEERLKENDALRSQLGETKELLQQERLNVWVSVLWHIILNNCSYRYMELLLSQIFRDLHKRNATGILNV